MFSDADSQGRNHDHPGGYSVVCSNISVLVMTVMVMSAFVVLFFMVARRVIPGVWPPVSYSGDSPVLRHRGASDWVVPPLLGQIRHIDSVAFPWMLVGFGFTMIGFFAVDGVIKLSGKTLGPSSGVFRPIVIVGQICAIAAAVLILLFLGLGFISPFAESWIFRLFGCRPL